MNLAINLIGTSNESGSKTYCVNFYKNLKYSSHINNYKKIIIFISQDYLKKKKLNQYKKNIKIISVNPIFSNGVFKIIYDQFIFPIKSVLYKAQVIFCPLNYCPLIFFFFKKKIILGIHSNLIWLYPKLLPGNYLKKICIKFLMTKSILLADKIIFCSKNSKKELEKKIRLNTKKNYYVHLGCDHIKKNTKKKIVKKKNILINSSITRYHDIILIFKALILLKKNNIQIPKILFLTQILDKKFYIELCKFIEMNNLKNNIFFYDNVPNNLTIKFYEKSFFSINSSKIESFGFPSLESMRRNCPVILSNYKTFKEINKNAALYFQQNNIKQLSDCIKFLLKSKSKRNSLIKRGKIVTRQYTWKKTLNETLKIISSF